MTRSKVIGLTLSGAAAAASTGLAQEKDLADTLNELLPGMNKEKIPDRRGPQQQWQEICFQAGAPGNEDRRTEVCRLMTEKLGPDTGQPARIWLLKQLERIGRGECVDALATTLGDKDVHVRDAARRALANSPAPEANAKLLAALPAARDSKFKAGLLNALGFRGDPASVAAAAKELTNRDPLVAGAAARALGKIANAEAAKALKTARTRTKGEVRLRISDAYLLCADNLLEQGRTKEAAAVYAELNKPDEAKPIRLAAVQGMLKTVGRK